MKKVAEEQNYTGTRNKAKRKAKKKGYTNND